MMTAELLIAIVAQVLLRDPTNELVVPLVEELSRRLSVKGSDSSGHDGSEGEDMDLDENVGSTMRSDLQNEQDDNIPGSDGMLSSKWLLTWLYFSTNRWFVFFPQMLIDGSPRASVL